MQQQETLTVYVDFFIKFNGCELVISVQCRGY